MKVRRVVRSIGVCNAIVLVGIAVSVCLLLYTETIHRKIDEEEILFELRGFVKKDGWRKIEERRDKGKHTEVDMKVTQVKKTREDGLVTPRVESKNKLSTKDIFHTVVNNDGKILFSQTANGEEDCFRFEKDRSNWTIKYRNEITRGCLQKKFHPKWVKRIILANGTAVYRGCTQKGRRCGINPYFDRKLNTRINTPPCCLKHIIEIFRNFADLIGRFGGRYFLFGGGLIGWYRNRKIVPYDHDLDIIVALDFWKSKRFKLFLNELGDKYGYHVKWLGWNKIKIYYSKSNHNFIDLWPFSRRGKDRIKIKSRMWKVHNASHLLPLKKSLFEGFPIWVPRRPKSLLTAEYGGGWQNELTCKVIGKYGNCKA